VRVGVERLPELRRIAISDAFDVEVDRARDLVGLLRRGSDGFLLGWGV